MGSCEIIFCDCNNDCITYVEPTNCAVGTFDCSGDMLIITERKMTVPTARPAYIAEDVANKTHNLLNPNRTGYTSTLAVYNAIQAVITGDTGYTFEGSGVTSVVSTPTGNTIHTVIYTPSAATPTWGNIIGTLSGQTDLQNVLDGKTAVLLFNNYTGITAPTTYAPIVHSHTCIINSGSTSHISVSGTTAQIYSTSTGNTFTVNNGTTNIFEINNVGIITNPNIQAIESCLEEIKIFAIAMAVAL